MSDLFGKHIVGFPTRRLNYAIVGRRQMYPGHVPQANGGETTVDFRNDDLHTAGNHTQALRLCMTGCRLARAHVVTENILRARWGSKGKT